MQYEPLPYNIEPLVSTYNKQTHCIAHAYYCIVEAHLYTGKPGKKKSLQLLFDSTGCPKNSDELDIVFVLN